MLNNCINARLRTKDAVTQELIDQLPHLLRCGADSFNSLHEKTIFIYTFLAACGSLLTNGWGIYNNRKIYPNIFFLLSANAASNKSSLTAVYDLLHFIHQELLSKSTKAKDFYKQQLASKTNKGETIAKPKFKVPIIPGNISASRLIEHLVQNGEDTPSLVIVSELDTLTQANKSDFGGFSDSLRLSFHNEKISYSRKSLDEFYEIEKPKLGLIGSGTPKQLLRLIPSAEDGLLSRCCIYSFDPEIKWMDVSPSNGNPDISTAMRKLGQEVYKFWKFFERREVEFQLSDYQWERLNNIYARKLDEIASIGGGGAISICKRSAVISYKLVMVLMAIRAFEYGELDSMYEAYDRDFESALILAELAMEKSLELLEKLPDGENLTSRQQKREMFKKKLPDAFSRNELVQLAKEVGITERTMDRWLDKWIKDCYVKRESQGSYKKVA